MCDMPTAVELAARTEVISGLRQLADYLDRHPAVPVSEFGWDVRAFARRDTDETARAQVDQIAAVLDVQVHDDTEDGGHYYAAKTFGLITYKFVHVPARRRAEHDALMSYSGNIAPDDKADTGRREAA
jgi:hypothetical protein